MNTFGDKPSKTVRLIWSRLSYQFQAPKTLAASRPVNFLKCAIFMTAIGLVLAPFFHSANAQRIYNKKRDEQAQQVQKQAAEIKSDPLFEAQMKNLVALEALDVEVVMRDATRDTRAIINSFETWDKVFIAVDNAKRALSQSDVRAARSSRNIAEATAALTQQIKAAKAAIKRLRDNSDTSSDGRLKMLFARAGELDSLLEMAGKLIDLSNSDKAAGNIKALDQTRDTLKVITDLYNKYDARVKEIATLKEELGEFYVTLQEMALKGLTAQEEHLKILGAIETRRALELQEARLLIARYEAEKKRLEQDYYGRCFGLRQPVNVKKERITDTFKLALQTPNCRVMGSLGPNDLRPRDVAEDLMQLLFKAATIVSRVPISTRLATLRRAHEAHRYAIRQRLLQARVYELTLTAGADRLALFYKGGIKPGQLAQLIYNVANVATPITILAR